MVFASTGDTVRKAFSGCQVKIQASDKTDLDYAETKKLVTKDTWIGGQEESALV